MVHGHGEHIGRYEEVAEQLGTQKIAFLGYDLIGHGESPGKRGHFPTVEGVLDSITELLNSARELYPDTPIFLMGHSMGGNLVSQFVLKRQPQVAGVILSAPWFQPAFEPPKLEITLAKLMYRIYPAFAQATKLDANGISSDPSEIKAYQDDPKIHDMMTPGLYMGITQGTDYIFEHAASWHLPLLAYHGSGDPIISFDATKEFTEKAGGGDVTFHEWKGLRHEPHHEPQKQAVIQRIADWINGHLSQT